jgi:hypothetical protein
VIDRTRRLNQLLGPRYGLELFDPETEEGRVGGYGSCDIEVIVVGCPPKRRSQIRQLRCEPVVGLALPGVMAGFLFLYPAFVVRAQSGTDWRHLAMLGWIGAAAAIGTFGGTAAAGRIQLRRPTVMVIRCTIAVTAVAAGVVLISTLYAVAVAALTTSVCSAFAKSSLDASLQDELPQESIASGVGLSESLLQMGCRRQRSNGDLHRTASRLPDHLGGPRHRAGTDNAQLPWPLSDPQGRPKPAATRPARE